MSRSKALRPQPFRTATVYTVLATIVAICAADVYAFRCFRRRRCCNSSYVYHPAGKAAPTQKGPTQKTTVQKPEIGVPDVPGGGVPDLPGNGGPDAGNAEGSPSDATGAPSNAHTGSLRKLQAQLAEASSDPGLSEVAAKELSSLEIRAAAAAIANSNSTAKAEMDAIKDEVAKLASQGEYGFSAQAKLNEILGKPAPEPGSGLSSGPVAGGVAVDLAKVQQQLAAARADLGMTDAAKQKLAAAENQLKSIGQASSPAGRKTLAAIRADLEQVAAQQELGFSAKAKLNAAIDMIPAN